MQDDHPVQSTTELTEREKEILRLLATGVSNKDIAQHFFISSNTVKVHLRNIFAKIGVASRTEAALFAIHAGLSQSPESQPTDPATYVIPAITPIPLANKRKSYFLWIRAVVIVLFVGVVATFGAARLRTPSFAIPISTPTIPMRWQELAAMPTARSGLAMAVYENKIYTIGGETAHSVTGVMEQYDVATDSWTTLTPKPVPVTDINAAVIGGKIYIPGGRLASGGMTDVLESYDPSRNLWEKHATLPLALSGYALAAFEGKLYVFGGWDGQKSLASVYEYNPEQDRWSVCSPMPTARAYAGAAVAGDNIYVLGGYDGKQALDVNEVFSPQFQGHATPWIQVEAMPAGRYAMGVTSIADIVYVIGGQGTPNTPLLYSPQTNLWESFDPPPVAIGEGLSFLQLGDFLYVIGGRVNNNPSDHNLKYQAIYMVEIPLIIHK